MANDGLLVPVSVVLNLKDTLKNLQDGLEEVDKTIRDKFKAGYKIIIRPALSLKEIEGVLRTLDKYLNSGGLGDLIPAL